MSSPESNSTQSGSEQDALDSNKTMEMSAAELAAAHAGTTQAPPTSFVSAKRAAARAAIAKAALATAAAKAAPAAAPAEAAPAPITFSQAASLEDQVQSEGVEEAWDEPAAAPGTSALGTKRRRVWLSILLCVAAVPVAVTLAGILTAPPRISRVPSGHLITLQADPSSAALHGLFVAGPGQPSRLLARDEPQARGGAVREQITQPVLSPDSTQLAFEKQYTTFTHGTSSVDTQIWVMPMTPDTGSPPHLVLDLTRQKLKQIAGLAWDSDSSLLFLEDGASYSVATETDDAPLVTPLDLHGLIPVRMDDVSATCSPVLAESGTFAYAVQTLSGPHILTQSQGRTTPGPDAAVFALSPSGDQIAFVPPGSANVIRRYDLARQSSLADIPVHWRWSLFGDRQITSLRWSPDGTAIACTVSKSLGADNELFLVTLATGRTAQLPYRTAPGAWDWGK